MIDFLNDDFFLLLHEVIVLFIAEIKVRVNFGVVNNICIENFILKLFKDLVNVFGIEVEIMFTIRCT